MNVKFGSKSFDLRSLECRPIAINISFNFQYKGYMKSVFKNIINFLPIQKLYQRYIIYYRISLTKLQ